MGMGQTTEFQVLSRISQIFLKKELNEYWGMLFFAFSVWEDTSSEITSSNLPFLKLYMWFLQSISEILCVGITYRCLYTFPVTLGTSWFMSGKMFRLPTEFHFRIWCSCCFDFQLCVSFPALSLSILFFNSAQLIYNPGVLVSLPQLESFMEMCSHKIQCNPQ